MDNDEYTGATAEQVKAAKEYMDQLAEIDLPFNHKRKREVLSALGYYGHLRDDDE